MILRKKNLNYILVLFLLSLSLTGCNAITPQGSNDVTIRIISTSDLHGRMLAYDYALDQPDSFGSLAQVASAINEHRNENTILVDVGDSIQDNLAEIFNDDPIHPMVLGMNAIGYDLHTAGNHEFNFGMDIARKYIDTCEGDFVLGNVYDEGNNLLADSYKIIEKSGVRIAFIGMITPNIQKWDKVNLQGYTITDPAEETNKIIDSIESDVKAGTIEPVDLFVGVFHMMESDEYNVPNSGVDSMAKSCPRLNLILASHGHKLVNKTLSENMYITENLGNAGSIQIADITVTPTTEKSPSSIKEITTTYVEMKDYPEDPTMVALLSPYNSRAKEYANTKIGCLEGGALIPEIEIKGINAALISDTPLETLIQNVMLHYSGADIAVSALCGNDDNALPGDLTLADASRMYKYSNVICCVKMNGSQVKKYLEWSASFYKQYQDGDLIIAFEDIPIYMYDSMSGVNYDIDISKPVGERIVNLSYPDGKIIKDTDEFKVAISNYRYNTAVSVPGIIFDESELPELVDEDITDSLNEIRYLIIDYIQNVKGGTISNECDNNWKIIGNNWDPELHDKAVSLINNGTLKLTQGAKNNPCISKITSDDLP